MCCKSCIYKAVNSILKVHQVLDELHSSFSHYELTCFVGCKLQITNFPLFFLALRGSEAAGNICKEVPRQRERSALLQ